MADALQKELGAPKAFAENVQSNMFPMHIQTALKVVDSFQWEEEAC